MSHDDDVLEPMHVAWEPEFEIGHALIDAQHQGLLAQCDALAALCLPADEAQDGAGFDQAVEHFKALVRQHFDSEAAVLREHGCSDLSDQDDEAADFEALVNEIATPQHFDRVELQRFLAVWSLGHVAGSVAVLRSLGGR